jgi:hypothetical protein
MLLTNAHISRNLDFEIVAFIEPIRLVGFGFSRRVRAEIFMLHPWSINISCVHLSGHTVHPVEVVCRDHEFQRALAISRSLEPYRGCDW